MLVGSQYQLAKISLPKTLISKQSTTGRFMTHTSQSRNLSNLIEKRSDVIDFFVRILNPG